MEGAREKERTREDQTFFCNKCKAEQIREPNEFLDQEGEEREDFWDLRNKDKGKEIQLQRFLFSPNPLLPSPHLIFKACHLVPSLP